MNISPALKGLHIAVTRPVDQAQSLCATLQQHGGTVIEFPLIAIVPLSDCRLFEQQITQLPQTDWAIFISSNAVDCAMPRIIKKYGCVPKNLKFAAIGTQTAKTLRHYGIQEILTPQDRFDSESLLALPELQTVTAMKIAIFRGEGGRDLLKNTLTTRGAQVDLLESYRRVNPQKNTQLLETCWQKGTLDAVIVTSSEAMRHLLDMAGNSEWLRHTTLCVAHARIAELPLKLGLEVLITEAPNDEAFVRCLAQIATH